MRRRPHLAFGALLLLLAVPLALRAAALSPLYLDSALRGRVHAALEETAKREGWLLSDFEVRQVSGASATLVHRPHRRGADPAECFELDLSAAALRPCDAAR